MVNLEEKLIINLHSMRTRKETTNKKTARREKQQKEVHIYSRGKDKNLSI